MTAIRFAFPLADGLHARPASLLSDLCRRYDVSVVLRHGRRRADAASVLALVAAAIAQGAPCVLEVRGRQEREAAAALRAFVGRELARADDVPAAVAAAGTGWLPPAFQGHGTRIVPGRALAAGSGRGTAWPLRPRPPLPRRFAAGRRDPRQELRLFRAAQLEAGSRLRRQAESAADPGAAAILKAQLAILVDPGFAGRIARLIGSEKLPAGAAIARTAAAVAAAMRRAPSAYLRERATDIHDIAAMLGEELYGQGVGAPPPLPPSGCVLLAATLSASELLALDRRRLRALVLGEVGATAHVAIVARSLGIPAVSLPAAELRRLAAGSELIVDGRRGLVMARPAAALKRYYRLEEDRCRRLERRRSRLAARPARTRDGRRLEIAANINSAAEAEPAWRQGAEGIGLFRSELLFLDRQQPPGEDEQYEAYARVARAAGKRTVIVRTLDVGGDKPLPYLALPPEANPFLGRRAVRFYAEHPELIRCQLRAILRAAAHGRHGRLKIMVPMIATLAEVRLARRLLAEAAAGLRQRRVAHAWPVALGIMVETPAAALAVDLLAGEADFFSVGSNDLLQYVMAADRGNEALAGLSDPRQPAFLRLLLEVARRARKARRWLGLCGEMAGAAELLPLLVGIGFDELSMAPRLIPAAKERLARLDSGECRALLRRARRCPDAGAVAALLAEFNGRDRGAAAAITAAGLVRLGSASRTAAEAIKELCDMAELDGRVADSAVLEEAVWKREATYATDLGLGFAIPHAKSPAVRSAFVAFLRPARAIRWAAPGKSPVRGVLLIAVPEDAAGDEHLRLIAGLSRRLMHDEFRQALLSARRPAAVLAALAAGLAKD